MNKRILIPIALLILSSCNVNDPEMIRQQIKKKKDQVAEMNKQITELEGLLSNDSPTEDKKSLIPVSLKEMNFEAFNHYFSITGKLEAEQDAFISPEMNGQIKSIYVKEGQRVNKGELLVALNTSVTENSIREVKTGLELAAKLYEKQKELWDKQIGSELQYLEARNAMLAAEARLATLEAQLEMSRVTAPFDGIIETISLKEGEMASPGMRLIQMVSLGKMKLYADISERYLGSLKMGDIVRVDFPDLPELDTSVPIHRIGNVVDDRNRTFRIEMKIHNVKERLKPNMFCSIHVNDLETDKAFVVPSIIIKQDIKGNYLYIANHADNTVTAKKRYVETGLSYEDRTMILAGIKEGEFVIIKGYSEVSDGTIVNVLN